MHLRKLQMRNGENMERETVIVLDFGGQYNQLSCKTCQRMQCILRNLFLQDRH